MFGKGNLLVFIFMLVSQLTAWTQATVYYRASEFGNTDFESYKSVKHENTSLILTAEDGSEKIVDLRKESVWGYRNEWGEDFRLRSPKKAERIVEFGAISVYVYTEVAATPATEDVAPREENQPYRLSRNYSFSIRPEGRMIRFSRSRLLRALKSNKEAYDKLENDIKENSNDLLIKIIEYNHTKETI